MEIGLERIKKILKRSVRMKGFRKKILDSPSVKQKLFIDMYILFLIFQNISYTYDSYAFTAPIQLKQWAVGERLY